MNISAFTRVTVCAAIIALTATRPMKADTADNPSVDPLVADLELLQGSWELIHGNEGQGAATIRSVKTIVGNRETLRRYRLDSGEPIAEHTVEFALSRSGAARIFTFSSVGESPRKGLSYLYKIDRDDFFDIPGLLDEAQYRNYQQEPRVWHWRRIGSNVKAQGASTDPHPTPATLLIKEASRPSSIKPSDSAVRPTEKSPGSIIDGWEKIVDPDNDCRLDAGVLRVRLPAGNHDLNPLRGMSAPRVLRRVIGDFEVEVKVTADVKPGTNPAGKGRPFNGAGILIWQSPENFLRIERNAWWSGDAYVCYPPLIEYWRAGRCRGFDDSPTTADFFPGPSTWLKARRHGSEISVSMSHDGKKWIAVKTCSVGLSDDVQVGVAALNTSDKPWEVDFEDLTITLQ